MSDRRLSKLTLRELMGAWLRNQDPDKKYLWREVNSCACAQFAAAIGRRQEWLMCRGRTNCGVMEQSPWRELNAMAQMEPHTFGALLKRLEQMP